MVDKSQDQILSEWLDNEIAKISNDIDTLSRMIFYQRAHPNHGGPTDLPFAYGCCCNMVSEQRDEAIEKNTKILERKKERLASLNLARACEFDDFPELNRVFGVQCTFDFKGEFLMPPPIVKWSPHVYNLDKILQLDFLLVLSTRTLIVRHNIFKGESVFALSSVELPNIQDVRVSKWPEIILFVFEHNGDRRYLHFSPVGLGGRELCFLK